VAKTKVKELPVVDARYDGRGHTGSYTLKGKCFNCHTEVKGIFNKGYNASAGSLGPQCPVCECRKLYWDGITD
jgi:hypothetical protein